MASVATAAVLIRQHLPLQQGETCNRSLEGGAACVLPDHMLVCQHDDHHDLTINDLAKCQNP